LDEYVTSIFTIKEQAKQESTMKQVASRGLAGFLLGLFFDLEDGDMFLQKICLLSADYMVV
jgi:hypothetical protein